MRPGRKARNKNMMNDEQQTEKINTAVENEKDVVIENLPCRRVSTPVRSSYEDLLQIVLGVLDGDANAIPLEPGAARSEGGEPHERAGLGNLQWQLASIESEIEHVRHKH